MSRRRSQQTEVPTTSGASRIPLIGLDVSRALALAHPRLRSWVPLLVVAIVGALLLASLRMDVIRMRFQVASSLKQEVLLEEENRHLLVAMRELRDPARLASQARALGFGRAAQMIDLDLDADLDTDLDADLDSNEDIDANEPPLRLAPETPLYGPPLPADSPFEIASTELPEAGSRP